MKYAVIIATAVILLTFVTGIYPVRGNQMFPMVRDGDLAITVKLGPYNVGDVISYKADGERYFSRIVALEGSTVYIDQTTFLINGSTPYEDIFYDTTAGDQAIELTVPDGYAFVLNDYRNDTGDSRTIGCIRLDDLDGRIEFLFRRRGI